MNRIISLSLIIGLIAVSCTDPNTIGLEVQPTSDNIIISDTSSFSWQTSQTESEDSLRTDEALNLILGNISDDPTFIYNYAGFYTQILLTENNTDLGSNAVVDSVVMSYTYSGYYGVLEGLDDIWMMNLEGAIYKDSTYYSNTEIINTDIPYNYVESFTLNTESEESPVLKMILQNNLGQRILDLGNEVLKDNETFLENFHGLQIDASATNTMLYLNSNGSNSLLKIYYHNDESGTDTLSLDFELGGDAARVNIFNNKPLLNLTESSGKLYIQSMAGYKAKIAVNNTDSIKAMLQGKAINKVTMSFDIEPNSQSEYAPEQVIHLLICNRQEHHLNH